MNPITRSQALELLYKCENHKELHDTVNQIYDSFECPLEERFKNIEIDIENIKFNLNI